MFWRQKKSGCYRFHTLYIRTRLFVSKKCQSKLIKQSDDLYFKLQLGRLINCYLMWIMQSATQMRHRAAFDGTDGWKMPRRMRGCQTFLLKSVRRSSSGSNMSSLPSFDPWGSKSKASIPEAGRHTCEPPGPSCQQMVRSQAPRCLGHVQLQTCKLENWIHLYAIFSLGVPEVCTHDHVVFLI